jgi:4-nitrophenyl phosphatase
MPYDLTPHSAILLDLDGTVFKEHHPLPGAVELIARFNATGRKYACLTNHTYSAPRIAQCLAHMGIPIDPSHIYTAGDAAADYILTRFTFPDRKPRVFNLATDSFHDALDPHVTWANTPEDPCDVVANAAPLCTHATPDRQRIALELLRNGASLLGMCADRIYPSPRGIEFGAGAQTEMLAYAANVRPIYAGKPEAIFFQELCHKLGVEPGRCVLVGDNLESDIAGAKRMGMASILTLTGVTRAEDVPTIPERLRPHHIVRDLRDL